MGILQVHIQNFKIKNWKKCPTYTLSAMYTSIFTKGEKTIHSHGWHLADYNNDDKSKR